MAIISTLLVGTTLSVYIATRNEKGTQMMEPINASIYTRDWTCQKGRVWQISRDTMVAVCKNKYVDIRHSIDNKSTPIGIQLKVYEWAALVARITSIEDFLE